MARKNYLKTDSDSKPATVSTTVYRVARNQCTHAGVDYLPGDILPELPPALLNVHLPNLEIVTEQCEVKPAPTETQPEPSEPSDSALTVYTEPLDS